MHYEKNVVTYFISFANIIITITKQLKEYWNVASLNPKKTETGDKLCQPADKHCCPKCSLVRLSWTCLSLLDDQVAE